MRAPALDVSQLPGRSGTPTWVGPLLVATFFFVLTYVAGALTNVSLPLFLAFVTVTLVFIFVVFLHHPAYIVPSLIVVPEDLV